jgi:hypothetical protein
MFVFNNGGHFMYREHPEEFNSMFITWLDYWQTHQNDPPPGNFQLPK